MSDNEGYRTPDPLDESDAQRMKANENILKAEVERLQGVMGVPTVGVCAEVTHEEQRRIIHAGDLQALIVGGLHAALSVDEKANLAPGTTIKRALVQEFRIFL